jgi:hypothetical protein
MSVHAFFSTSSKLTKQQDEIEKEREQTKRKVCLVLSSEYTLFDLTISTTRNDFLSLFQLDTMVDKFHQTQAAVEQLVASFKQQQSASAGAQ